MTSVPWPSTASGSIYDAVVTSRGLPTFVNGARVLVSAYRPAPPARENQPQRSPCSPDASTATPLFDLLAAEWQLR